MPHFKKVEFVAENAAGAVDEFTLSIEIRANGTFYTHVPDKLLVSFDENAIDLRERKRQGFFVTSATTFHELVGVIKKAHKTFMEPIVKEEPVIVYNIESHVSFALTKDGRIFPNAGFEGASWPRDHGKKQYGDHHSCNPSEGGYSLIIGAKAMLKKTTTYGDKSSSRYEYYYKDESHLGHDNPAQLLNSWCSMELPENTREMPYSDEAAMFFFNLLKAMAELNRRVQEFTNTPEKLAKAISRNAGVLMLSNHSEKVKTGSLRSAQGDK